MAQVLLAEGLHNVEYVREQTDLPILVREDTGRYLRESDLRAGGSDGLLYFWDEASDAPPPVPGSRGEGGSIDVSARCVRAWRGRHRHSRTVSRSACADARNARTPDANHAGEVRGIITGVGAGTIQRVARTAAAPVR
jgi:hypothetical protein